MDSTFLACYCIVVLDCLPDVVHAIWHGLSLETMGAFRHCELERAIRSIPWVPWNNLQFIRQQPFWRVRLLFEVPNIPSKLDMGAIVAYHHERVIYWKDGGEITKDDFLDKLHLVSSNVQDNLEIVKRLPAVLTLAPDRCISFSTLGGTRIDFRHVPWYFTVSQHCYSINLLAAIESRSVEKENWFDALAKVLATT